MLQKPGFTLNIFPRSSEKGYRYNPISQNPSPSFRLTSFVKNKSKTHRTAKN
jgi:hypothetical protein